MFSNLKAYRSATCYLSVCLSICLSVFTYYSRLPLFSFFKKKKNCLKTILYLQTELGCLLKCNIKCWNQHYHKAIVPLLHANAIK